jgi:hypothetical protein
LKQTIAKQQMHKFVNQTLQRDTKTITEFIEKIYDFFTKELNIPRVKLTRDSNLFGAGDAVNVIKIIGFCASSYTIASK